MKKVFLIVLVAALVVTGFFLFQKKEQIPTPSTQELTMDKEIGVVSKNAQNIANPITEFFLVTENGQALNIDSVSVNLRKYEKRRIEAEGKWNANKTIFNVENVKSLGHEIQIKQSYQNPAMGLKFSYPTVWALKEQKSVTGADKIIITPYEVADDELSSVDNIVIERSENNRKSSARQWLNLDEMYRPVDSTDKNMYQRSTVGLAQFDAVKKTSVSGNQIEFFMDRDINIYRFAFTTINDADKDVSQNVFYEIVSSFEFIPFSDTASSTSLQSGTQTPLTSLPTTQVASSTVRQSFVDYIKSHISALAFEPTSDVNGWQVTRLEFAYSESQPDNFTAIYVTYRDSAASRKILLSVPDRTKLETATRIAYFIQGDTTDWVLNQGTDIARDYERTAVSVAGSSAQETVIKSGMRLIDAKSFNIKIQYPASWYWAFMSGGYNFSDRPVTSGNVLIRLEKDPAPLPSMTNLSGAINGMQAQEGRSADGNLWICVQTSAKYCITGSAAQRDIMIQVIGTLQ